VAVLQPAQPLNVVGASDGRYFAADGIEILVTGPGDGADSHVPNEFVRVNPLGLQVTYFRVDQAFEESHK